MFFRKQDDTLTIDQVDLANLHPPLEYNSNFFHEELFICIRNAVEEKDFTALKYIVDKVTPIKSISTDRVIDAIYFTIIAREYSAEEFEKVLANIPIDINRSITNSYQFLSNTVLEVSSLLNIAASFSHDEIFILLLNKGADVNKKSFENETAEEYLKKSLNTNGLYSDFKRSNRERMLESLEKLKEEPEQTRSFRF